MIVDKFLLAEMLNGRAYREEITPDIKEALKGNDLVIVYGSSDDLMKFEGAIRNEVGCFNGGAAYLTHEGLLQNKCRCGCQYFEEQKNKAVVISAVWGVGDYSWTYETVISHATFDIIEDDEKYCRGIVFNLSDVKL